MPCCLPRRCPVMCRAWWSRATDRLSVPEGASATLLFQSGEMLRLRGPFEGTLGQQQAKAGRQQRRRCSPTCSASRGRRDGDRRHPLDRCGATRPGHRRRPGRCAALRHLLRRADDIGVDHPPGWRPAHLRAASQGQHPNTRLARRGGAHGVAGGRSDRRRQPVRDRDRRRSARYSDLSRHAVCGRPRSPQQWRPESCSGAASSSTTNCAGSAGPRRGRSCG